MHTQPGDGDLGFPPACEASRRRNGVLLALGRRSTQPSSPVATGTYRWSVRPAQEWMAAPLCPATGILTCSAATPEPPRGYCRHRRSLRIPISAPRTRIRRRATMCRNRRIKPDSPVAGRLGFEAGTRPIAIDDIHINPPRRSPPGPRPRSRRSSPQPMCIRHRHPRAGRTTRMDACQRVLQREADDSCKEGLD